MRNAMWMGLVCALLVVTGCSSNNARVGPPELGTDLTYDGLAPVKNPRARNAWMRPDFTLAGYTKIMLVGAGIEFRPVNTVNRSRLSTATQFPLTPAQQERLRSVVSDAFRSELSQSQNFQLVTEPGPDVLMIWGGLVDVVSNVPPQSAGRDAIFLSTVGQATLVIELRDSQSNAVLARIIDTRAAQPTGANQRSTSVTNWNEVQQLARSWAVRLREGLDEAAKWDN